VKRTFLGIGAMALCAMTDLGAQQTWTEQISDSVCKRETARSALAF
jgi:hypothetical protein